ncbi:uncharacterized protein [Littorina saxatilis]|uniref:uncharacterized protein n=1 Tax=Littorina saxatilis TaxID=31220 RepID=UPI0038B5D1FC
MDPTHRAILNEFGLVQHAAFQSPDHNTVHVIYGHTNIYFVHSELTEELKTRTGLQLVPPQSRVATSSSTADSVLIVIVDTNDSVTDVLLPQAVETSGHTDSHTLFIQMGDHCPDWFEEKLPRCPVMIYPEPETHHHPSYVLPRQSSVSAGASSGLKDVRTLFWDNVSTMIGASYMDPTDRAILNEFGLVQHAVLQSPDHNTVHVIYGNITKRFLHSELTEELKTRTGLQLVPPQSRVATSSSTADSFLIVIVDCHDSVTDRLLREAVETSGHTDSHTLFIQKGYRRPDWVEEKLPRFLMIYPGAYTGRKDVRTFWDNVSTMIGDPHMDPTHRAMLNEFGLVQHAAFQSPDHNTVHVIYGHTNKHFVHIALTEELKTRTGLQLVPPQSRVATSSSTADSFLIVIVDRHDSVTDRLLREAVETSGHTDSHTLFIQTGYRRPDWFEEKLPRFLMIYPRCEEDDFLYDVYRQSSMSAGASTERTLFWDNVSTMIGDPHMDPTHRAMLNEFGLVQHAAFQSPDHNTVHVIYSHTNKHFVHIALTEELETRTGLQLVPPQSRVATSSSTADSVLIVIVEIYDSVTDRLLRQAVETSGHPDTHTLFIQMVDHCLHWVEEKLPRCTLMRYRRSEMLYPSYVLRRLSSVSAGASSGLKDVRTLFWDNVSTMIGASYMDPTDRAILNEFGLVQHAVLQSPDHNTVHVIYGHTNKHFVHSELTEELKTRTGLQLVPPQSRVATSSSTADSVLIVIVDRHDSVTNRLLRQAVETSGHTDSHTLFIQTGYRRPDWVEETLPRFLMIYPRCEEDDLLYDVYIQSSMSASASIERKDVRTLFWDNVSTMIGDPHMDPTHRAILNEFSLVQHAVLQSPDHNTVHVIYGHTNNHFVHSELTEELKTRTGLQLVPPQSRVATSSFPADSVLIVIIDRHDSVTDRLLSQAVETSGHPDTHTLFIQMGDHCPDWFEEKLPRCPVMISPEPEMHHHLYVLHRQSSVSAGASSGLKDVRTLFWDNVSTMIGDPHMDPTRRAMLNEFGPVHHAVLQSPDHNTVHVIYAHTKTHFVHSELTEELKTRTGLQLVPPQSHVATSSSTADSVLIVIVDRHDSVTDRKSFV